MKRISAQLVLILLVFSLVVPGLVLGQQTETPQGNSSSGAKPGNGLPGRRTRRNVSPKTAAVERDFDEALKLIQEQYIDGRKLNYNDVFK